MRIHILLIILLAISGCATTPTTANNVSPATNHKSYYVGGNGLSLEQAIFFPNAKSSMDGIPLEGKWIADKYPNSKKHSQAIINSKKKLYDKITIKTAKGEEKHIYFDMTSWFGLPKPKS